MRLKSGLVLQSGPELNLNSTAPVGAASDFTTDLFKAPILLLMDIQALDELYRRYRFEPLPIKQEQVRAYGLSTGYFVNADVVPLAPGADATSAKVDLEAAGFACAIRSYTSLADAEEHLFSGFFAAESSRLRLRQDYNRFVRQASDSLGTDGSYSYVCGPFESDSLESDGDVVSHIVDLFSRDGSILIILEAAAGFGKTCTSYEVLRKLLDRSVGQVPILTEFSLNRRADIFRYVLLDEIDRNFPSLSSDLVQEQIRRGRTPLILDGFDELLSSGLGGDDAFEDVEPMLETISQLLDAEAKVLLTTRSTAIFSEQEFESWIGRRPGVFDVVRVRLRRPSLTDWLGHERIAMLESGAVPIAELANPVLLAYLRNLEDDKFEALVRQPEGIVARYFDSLLEREMTRQSLRLNPARQRRIFMSLAADMMRERFTSDAREYLQLRIQESHGAELSRVREDYAADERPTVEELASKLANHALLDREGRDDNKVGFVNDFVLGTLAGDVLREGGVAVENVGDMELFINLASTAYVPRLRAEKQQLYGRLVRALDLLDPTQQLYTDLSLMGEPQRAFDRAAIEGVQVERCTIGAAHIQESTFVDCLFRDVTFKAAGLHSVTFVGCEFYRCLVEGVSAGPVWVLSCRGDESYEGVLAMSVPPVVTDEGITDVGPIEQKVLENFWPPGRQYASTSRLTKTLFRGHAKSDYKQVAAAIERLRKRGYLDVEGERAQLVTDRISEIGLLLGR